MKLKRNFIAKKCVAKSRDLIQLQFLFCVHEGLPKSTQTESITKYTLIFIVFRCKPLLKQSIPSLLNGSSLCATVGSTAGTDFFELRVTRLVIIHKFPARPGNNDLAHGFFLGHKKRRN